MDRLSNLRPNCPRGSHHKQAAGHHHRALASRQFQGFFRGVGRMDVVLYATIIQIPVRVAAAWLLAGIMGICAVAAATAAGWLCMAAYQAFEFRRYLRAAGLSAAKGAKKYEICL